MSSTWIVNPSPRRSSGIWVEWNALDNVGVATLDPKHPSVVIGNEIEAHLVQVRLSLLPVMLIALDRDMRARDPLLQLEGAGSDGFCQ